MKYRNLIKKLQVGALVTVLILSLAPTTVFAEPQDENETTESVEITEDAIYISTAEDILVLAENCVLDTWSVDKVVVLENDIDMSGVAFTGIPTFGGIFAGQGYTIRGLDMTHEGSVVGFFRYAQSTAVIDSLNIEGNIQPEGTAKTVGGIVAINGGTIQNCTFTGEVSGKEIIGGIVGLNKGASIIQDCTSNGLVYGDHYIGGIVGENKGVVRRCENMAEVNTAVEHNSLGLDMSVDLDSLTSNESLDNATNLGGIAGTSTGVIRECYNKANVGYQKMGHNVGGIVGSQNGYVVDCINYAKIQGSDGVGGIVGQFKPNIVLEFGEDPMEAMSKQMDAMMNSMRDLSSSMGEIELSLGDASLDMDSEMDSMKEALESLQNKENLENLENLEGLENLEDLESLKDDTDLLDSLVNDFSNSYDKIYKETEEIAQSFSGISDKMNSMISQMEDMMSSMDSISTEMTIEDVSRYDTKTDTIGKVANCLNYGEVSGEKAIGGIAGMLDSEMMMDEDDVEQRGEQSSNVSGTIRLVVRECKNYGTISSSKSYAGGIGGKMAQGAIISCVNNGNVDAINASYVGGIVGNSETIVMNSYSKCIISGASYVGGIAGLGTEVSDSYALVDIAAAKEFAGGIFGSTEKLPGSSDSAIKNSYYYMVGKNRGAIDGISYHGAAEAISLEEFLALENLDDVFKMVTVRFIVEGQEDKVFEVEMNGSLAVADIPVLTVEEDEMYDWVFEKPVTDKVLSMGEVEETIYISENRLSNILFDQIYEADFEAKHMVSAGEEKTESNRSKILAVGAFDKNTFVELVDMLQKESVILDTAVVENWKVNISNMGVEKLHYYVPDGMDAESIQLFVKTASGTWEEREYMVEGSYIIFAFTDGDTNFALAETTTTSVPVVVVVIIVVLAVAVVLLRKKSLQKKSKASKQKSVVNEE